MHSRNADEQEAIEKRFGENLRRIREDRGLIQEGLADLAGIHRTEASQLEPRMTTLVKLATVFEVPLGELIAGIEWRPYPRSLAVPNCSALGERKRG